MTDDKTKPGNTGDTLNPVAGQAGGDTRKKIQLADFNTDPVFRKSWIDASRKIFRMAEGREVPQGMGDEKIIAWSLNYLRNYDSQLLDWRSFERVLDGPSPGVNLSLIFGKAVSTLVGWDIPDGTLHGGSIGVMSKLKYATQEQKDAFRLLSDFYDRIDDNNLAVIWKNISDPVSVFTMAGGLVASAIKAPAKQAVTTAVKTGIKAGIDQGLKATVETAVTEGGKAAAKKITVGAITAGAADATISGSAFSAARQNTDIEIGRLKQWSWGKFTADASISAVMSAVMVTGAHYGPRWATAANQKFHVTEKIGAAWNSGYGPVKQIVGYGVDNVSRAARATASAANTVLDTTIRNPLASAIGAMNRSLSGDLPFGLKFNAGISMNGGAVSFSHVTEAKNLARRMAGLIGKGDEEVVHQLDHAARIIAEADRRGITPDQMFDVISRETGMARAGEGKVGIDGLLHDRAKVLEKLETESLVASTPAPVAAAAAPATAGTTPAAAPATSATPGTTAPAPTGTAPGATTATPTAGTASTTATPSASTIVPAAPLNSAELTAIDGAFTRAMSAPPSPPADIALPEFSPGRDLLKLRIKFRILTRGLELPKFTPAPYTAMRMEPRPVVRPVVEAVDKLLAGVDQNVTGESSLKFKWLNFWTRDGAGRPEKVVNAIAENSFLGKMTALENKIIADAQRGANDTHISTLIDNFTTHNAAERAHLRAEVQKMKDHYLKNYRPHEAADIFAGGVNDPLPRAEWRYAFKGKVGDNSIDYSKYGMTHGQGQVLVDHLDHVLTTLDDLALGSKGRNGQQMIASAGQITRGEVGSNHFQISISRLSPANALMTDAQSRLTGVIPDGRSLWETPFSMAAVLAPSIH
jgi:hypothetical protein